MDLLDGEALHASFKVEKIKSCLEFRDCPLEFSGTELRVALFDHRSSGGDNGVFLATEEYARVHPSFIFVWLALRPATRREKNYRNTRIRKAIWRFHGAGLELIVLDENLFAVMRTTSDDLFRFWTRTRQVCQSGCGLKCEIPLSKF